MLSVDQAIELLLAEAAPLPARPAGLRHAAGRWLLRPAVAERDTPPFDNSAMDGFAVRAADLAGAGADRPLSLPLQGEIAAGDGESRRLEPGKALRINTGAPMPEGADAVVRIEDAKLSADAVQFFVPPQAGLAVRRAGDDYRAGVVLLEAGRRLDPAALGVLASLGMASAWVSRPPRVALLATGDEIVDPGRPLARGQIYNSTRYALLPLLEQWGAEAHDLGVVADDPAATRRAIEAGLDYDVLITTGGVSMGSRDLVKPTLLELGAREIFWQVKQRPGKPLFAARRDLVGRATLCLGLPGNPVSVFVTAMVYVRAALLRMQGAGDCALPWRRAVAGALFEKKPGLTVFARADLAPPEIAARFPAGAPVLVPSRGQGSHQFSAVASAAGLARLAEESGDAPPGAGLDFLELK